MISGSNLSCFGNLAAATQYSERSTIGAPVEAPIERIGAAFDAAAELVERVNRLAGRVAGFLPGPQEVVALNSAPSGVVPQMVERAETAISGINEANAALARLEALFGL